jgi:hypothetical protein
MCLIRFDGALSFWFGAWLHAHSEVVRPRCSIELSERAMRGSNDRLMCA